MSAAGSVVSIRGLSKIFGKGGVTALEGIDLEVERGEFVSLIGPSGCGKSTLLRLVGDIIGPDEGVVTVNGKPARKARSTATTESFPGTGPLRLAHGREEHRAAPRDARLERVPNARHG